MEKTPLAIRRPYYDSIPVGSGATPGLINGYRYVVYSSPLDTPIELYGFNANFASASVRVQMADVNEKDVWTPFFSTQMTAIFGSLSQAMPVLLLPQPYLLEAGHRVQFTMQNLSGGNISQTILTLVGLRLDPIEVLICSN